MILINRLKLNVIRAGLKRINLSYSRISFKDVKGKLNLPADADVEALICKAIRDSVLLGRVDFGSRDLIITENKDVYSTSAPQLNFEKRIDYCHNIMENCKRAMLYGAEEQIKEGEEDSEDDLDADDIEKLLDAMGEDFM